MDVVGQALEKAEALAESNYPREASDAFATLLQLLLTTTTTKSGNDSAQHTNRVHHAAIGIRSRPTSFATRLDLLAQQLNRRRDLRKAVFEQSVLLGLSPISQTKKVEPAPSAAPQQRRYHNSGGLSGQPLRSTLATSTPRFVQDSDERCFSQARKLSMETHICSMLL